VQAMDVLINEMKTIEGTMSITHLEKTIEK